jgi:malate dehydrogenase (oxaloacetate-decarboxylating)(NADP+)
MDEQLKQSALDFHEFPVPGKFRSPDQARWPPSAIWRWPTPAWRHACLEIEKDPLAAYKYTARGNLVAGGLQRHRGAGDWGYALAGKPVMEGKGVLFKKFAGIDVFDIEVDESRINLSTSWRRWSRPSAVSTSKISKRRSVSTSSKSCASA